ncbi:hypothetical protein [Sphingobium sp. YR768]|uniref:hypothetical protein n=1 Tax=Sphingobium sp. YR768 TaxID=1884365 RepID=UPI00115F8008|nr:hypothetical protein [Sphingobium sp. YR768]
MHRTSIPKLWITASNRSVGILDIGRTAVNIAGQVLDGVIVAKREGILDESAYYGERAWATA